jgi:Predicted transcriptional regulators
MASRNTHFAEEGEDAGAAGNGASGGGRAEAGAEDELTIEQLAGKTGMTVRNIRAHQSRGLLPPPTIRGRTGFYGGEHVTRLRLIAEMQADGFNLKAIDRLLAGAGAGSTEELLGFKRALTTPFEQEAPEFLDEADLPARFGDAYEGKLLAKSIKLGLLAPVGQGRYEVPSPTLLSAGEELARLGVAPEATIRVLEQLSRHSEGRGRGVRQALPRAALASVRGGRPSGGAPSRGAAGPRAGSAARLGGAARRLPAQDDPCRRAGVRA